MSLIHRLGLSPSMILVFAFGQIAGSPARAGDRTTAEGTPPKVTDRITAPKSVSGSLARTDALLLGRTDREMVDVVIKLDYDPTASYAGGISGLPATTPDVTGKRLDPDADDVKRYEAYLAGQEESFLNALASTVPGARIGQRLRTVYGGIAATVPANSVDRILAIPGVAAVQSDRLSQPLTDASPAFINATAAYAALGGTSNSGRGVIVGILDTGVWPEHPGFADLGNLASPPPTVGGGSRSCHFGDNPLTPAVDNFQCQNKLIGGQAFLETYLSVIGAEEFPNSARDSNGHGTHMATTVAGNVLANSSVLGIDRGAINGIAPGAWIMAYKVCGNQGCFASDVARAIAQAILDGVDVINYSHSGGSNPFADPVELAFLDAYAAGIFVSTATGNTGDAGGVGHHSPWVTTVAASTQTRSFHSTLTASGGGATVEVSGASITSGIASPLPIVLASAAPYNDARCSTPAPPGLFTGKIVACECGDDRILEGFNVRQGGAAGMVLYNVTPAEVEADSHWLPAVHLDHDAGATFLDFVTGHPGATGSFTAGQKVNGSGDVMAVFSSRGPGGLFVKPDLTAPGVQILAGSTPFPKPLALGPPGDSFQVISGTSIASAQVAGAAILLAALHPGWTPGQIKSALMTSATTEVLKHDRTTPADAFDFGAGRIDIGAAAGVPFTLDETAANYVALGNDSVNAVHLNVPSINAPVLPGRITTTRTVRNVSGSTQRITVVTNAPAGSSITVSPRKFDLDPGLTRTLNITIETSAALGEQQFGAIELRTRSGVTQHLPVAFVHTQGLVSLTQDCDPTTVPKGTVATCTVKATNNSFVDAVVNLDTFTPPGLPIVNVSGATRVADRQVQLHNVALPAAQGGTPSIGSGELFGYVPLDTFGVSPTPIGDEDIINLDVPAFLYAGQTWSRIGVDSNGYAIVGGGVAEDNNCCTLTQIPDPARPNNILAPFWTDLDGSAAPGIFSSTFTDGDGDWFVLEWRVNVFGTTSRRTFQIWIGLNGTEDITFAYDPASLPADPGQDFLVGAENRSGTGGGSIPGLPTGDLRVTSSPVVPGGSVTYSIQVKGAKPAAGTVRTEMTATGVPGVTVEQDKVTVTK